MGITAASLYNAFGDKRSLFKLALGRYIETGIEVRVIRERQSTVRAIDVLFKDIVDHSIRDKNRKGCLLVNSALELGDDDTELRELCRTFSVRLRVSSNER
jgi:TetR/AcrR family transcriptional repressor of nem operon